MIMIVLDSYFCKQARDIWIVLGKYEDWHLRVPQISRGDTSNALHVDCDAW